jgi:hypothetical protein
MLSTVLRRVAHAGRPMSRSLVLLAALFAFLAATSIALPVSEAQACGITRHVYNKTNLPLYVEIRKGGILQWLSTEPIKPGGTLSLEYISVGDTLILSGPNNTREWDRNPFGVILDFHRCDLIRIAQESKLDVYEVRVSRPSNADILIQSKR